MNTNLSMLALALLVALAATGCMTAARPTPQMSPGMLSSPLAAERSCVEFACEP
jgi:hypothetical protein